MTFNDPAFIQEVAAYVAGLGCKRILEVGARSGELMAVTGAEGIDIESDREDIARVDIRAFHPKKPFELVFSSGVLEHYPVDEAVQFLQAKARCSRRYVLTYVPNTNCLAYMNVKATTDAPWRDELDYTPDSLADVHVAAGLTIVDKGHAGAEWAARFGPEPSEPYLVWVLATV